MTKYIIELEDDIKYIIINGRADNCCYTLVRPVAELEVLNSDYINENFGGLQDEAYQAGLKDGWETALALVWDTSISEYETTGVNVESWDGETCEVLRRYPAHEAVELLRTIREHKDSDRIEVGDEVRTRDGSPSHTFLVTKVTDSHVYGISDDGSWNYWTKDEVTKTGKHYDIASILEAMRNTH